MLSMIARVSRCAVVTFAVLGVAVITWPASAAFNVFSDGGDATPASIQAIVDAFRVALGDPNNANNPGPLATGRREINWDGGGTNTATTTVGTLTAFQNSRGATFTTPGTGFLQTPLDAPELTAINPTYTTTFGTFSPLRIFTPTGSNVTEVTFSLPGSGGLTPATVSSFGAVFTDVDTANQTTIEFFSPAGNSLQVLAAPTGDVSSASLSFIGGVANSGERIARVRITTGAAALGPNDNPIDSVDMVAMDDFIYSEPVAIPEPTSVALAVVALVGAGVLMARRKCRG
jgi:hypothetical protein